MAETAEALLASPWIYLCIFLVSAFDGLFPFLPSDSTILAASVAAVSGRPSLALIILSAAVGVTLGDEVGYLIGRRLGSRNRLLRGRVLNVYTWATEVLRHRGALLISGGRYIPFGRIATILAAGAIGYPKTRFTIISGLSALVWSASLAALGYFSGTAFPGNPLPALAIAVLALLAVSWLVRIVHRRIQHHRRAEPAETAR